MNFVSCYPSQKPMDHSHQPKNKIKPWGCQHHILQLLENGSSLITFTLLSQNFWFAIVAKQTKSWLIGPDYLLLLFISPTNMLYGPFESVLFIIRAQFLYPVLYNCARDILAHWTELSLESLNCLKQITSYNLFQMSFGIIQKKMAYPYSFLSKLYQ